MATSRTRKAATKTSSAAWVGRAARFAERPVAKVSATESAEEMPAPVSAAARCSPAARAAATKAAARARVAIWNFKVSVSSRGPS